MLYFAQSPMPAGTTSRDFTLPETVNGGLFYLKWTRDAGALAADGTYTINVDAVVSVQQLQSDGVTQATLFTGSSSDLLDGDTAFASFTFDPNQGVLSVVNNGPGDIGTVQVHDELPRSTSDNRHPPMLR